MCLVGVIQMMEPSVCWCTFQPCMALSRWCGRHVGPRLASLVGPVSLCGYPAACVLAVLVSGDDPFGHVGWGSVAGGAEVDDPV